MKIKSIIENAQNQIWDSFGEGILINGQGPYIGIPEEINNGFEPISGSALRLAFKGFENIIASQGDRIQFVDSGLEATCTSGSFREAGKVIIQYEPD